MLVRNLDAILLTTDDLPTMELNRDDSPETGQGTGRRIAGMAKQPPIVDGFFQSWDGDQPEEHLYVKYWVFGNVADTQEAATGWYLMVGAEVFLSPEPNAVDVIGDATWRVPSSSSIWFIKKNVLVHIVARRPFIDQLALTRSVARKIEAKIEAAVNQATTGMNQP